MKKISFIFLIFFLITIIATAQKNYLFIGTYTSGSSKGIYVYQFDSKTGKASWISNTDKANNPSFLAIASDRKHIYAVNETNQNGAGQVSAYQFDERNGQLNLINQQSSGSADPCHVSITKDGKWLLIANYTGGSLASFQLNKDGSLPVFSQHIIHEGSSINKARQEKAHVHSAFLSPDEKFLLTPDLGMDQVSIYQFNKQSQKPIEKSKQEFIKCEPGSGPRHLEFSPDGNFLYIIEELTGTVSVHQYHDGNTKFIQSIATHPKDFTGQAGSADIHISKDGRFLYASNRGKENNIAIFKINKENGKLSAIGYQSTLGEGPRNFSLDPSNNFLLVANQLTNTIEIFNRDFNTGLLKHSGNQLQIPNPVCLKFMEVK